MKSILITVALLVAMVAGIRSEYFLLRYTIFAERVIENHESYDEEDWKQTIEKYGKYREEYQEVAADMSEEDRDKVDSLNYKLNALITRNKTKKVTDAVGSAVNEAVGTVKELLK